VSYYSPYVGYAGPVVRPYAAYYGGPAWGVYARPRLYAPARVVIW
jgi:hypothetical protein